MKKVSLILMILSLAVLSCKNSTTTENDEVLLETSKVGSTYGCAPPTVDSEWYRKNNVAPLLDGLDVLHYPITTNDPKAQEYFNQGLVLSYGFNHAEAARSFYYATRLDPECAMCFWGFAYVLGPNYNAGMEPDNYERAYDAIQQAVTLSDKVTEKEKALIDALAQRYVPEPVEDRRELDVRYSAAMEDLFNRYEGDPEIAALYAESVMDLYPWNLYDKEGEAREWTPKVIMLLEKVMKDFPDHPGAHHFYIHATEASKTPGRALGSAKKFDEGLVPGAGHLLHMPSHTYIQTGDYHKGSLANLRAVERDSAYVTLCHAQGAYPLVYYPHNYHFLAATATLEGNSKWALMGSEKLAKKIHPDIMTEPGWSTLQHYYMIPYFVDVKFAKWDKILARQVIDTLLYPEAISRYARGMAYLGKKDLQKAKEELKKLKVLEKDERLAEMMIWEINSMKTIVEIARKVLEAEILASEEQFDRSIILLEEAVALEDSLNFQEPPDWFFSVRHTLGAVQIEAGRYPEAVKTLKKDLEILPKNGWAQHGLKLAYEKMNDREKVLEMETALKDSWTTADVVINTSRIK
ncbi:tetratricopeptide repeat protein [Salinimicrobium sp. TH3]|uniref:tetratricopeptide repeat protein n=1 Tax=Salinimicrobium sp. TH3 TaxID=2997342 RepID=UPI0022748409|nr:tetratricopeptide repeat protein [Salinimicrobium sp. TH3]MCY2686035.1 tetratricopeptide repeat protein [Salinimicrobium sp. TH3]